VLEEALRGNGIVRAFPFVKSGQFNTRLAGHTTLVVMTASGAPVSDEVKRSIYTLLEQLVGSQFVYVLDPLYIPFDVGAQVRLLGVASQTATVAAVRRNLKDFYRPSRKNFGRDILPSEIITVVESTSGVYRIVSSGEGAILAEPLADIRLQPWQLPQLVSVDINVV